jgi:hypothetical protein
LPAFKLLLIPSLVAVMENTWHPSHWAKLSSFGLLLLHTPPYRVRLFVPSLRRKCCEVDSQAVNVHQLWNQPRINAIAVLTAWFVTAWFVPVTKLPGLHRDAPEPGPRPPEWQGAAPWWCG